MYGGGRDAGAGSNFGSENFGGGQGKNDYSSTPKTKFQKTYSILSNVLQGISKMVSVGRQKNKDVKANNALFGTSDYQGDVKKADFSTVGDGGNNSNVVIPLIKNSLTTTTGIAPTAAEVSQSKAADAYDSRKTKARGRSMTILTKPTGLKDDTLTLGRKSLLGR